MCDIIIYKRGSTGERTFSTGERTWESSVTHGDPDLLRPRIQKIKKMRYQRNKKIFIFSFLCPLIGLTEQGASVEVGIPRRDLVQPIRRVKKTDAGTLSRAYFWS